MTIHYYNVQFFFLCCNAPGLDIFLESRKILCLVEVKNLWYALSNNKADRKSYFPCCTAVRLTLETYIWPVSLLYNEIILLYYFLLERALPSADPKRSRISSVSDILKEIINTKLNYHKLAKANWIMSYKQQHPL